MSPWSPFFTAAVVGSSTDGSWRFAHASIVVSAAHPSIAEWFILVFIPRLLVILDAVVRLPENALIRMPHPLSCRASFPGKRKFVYFAYPRPVSGCTDCALDSGAMSALRTRLIVAVALAGAAGCGGGSGPQGPKGHVIEIDIDDHGLAGLWMANAPNLKGLIARGTLAFSRVDVPTHSNQNNMTLLTGQYPEGHNAPANGWLSRTAGFVSPVNLPGLTIGDYALWEQESAADARRQRLQGRPRRGRPHGVRRRAAPVRGRRRRRAHDDRRHQLRHDHRRPVERGAAARQRARIPGGRDQGLHVHGPARRRRDAAPLHAARRGRVRARGQDGPGVHVRLGLHRARRRGGRRARDRQRGGRRDHRGLRRGPGRAAHRDRRPRPHRQHEHRLHARPRQGRHAQAGRARHARRQRTRRPPTASSPPSITAQGAAQRPHHVQLRAAERGRRRPDLRQRRRRRERPRARRRRPTSRTSWCR